MPEKKDAAKAPKPPKVTKKAAAKPEAAPEAPAEAEKAGPANKKINKMTLAEIEARLNEVKASQGGLRSRYARQLLGRKKILAS